MDYIDRASQYLTVGDVDGSGGRNEDDGGFDLKQYEKLDTDTLVQVAIQTRGRGYDRLYRELVTMLAQRPDAPRKYY